MLLAAAISEDGARTDALFAEFAARRRAEGFELIGALQERAPGSRPDGPCALALRLLPGAQLIRISQDLGPLATGCRLDNAALAEAAGAIGAALQAAFAAGRPPALLLLNRFGKAEAEGQGFRDAIAEALGAGVPVLTATGPRQQAGFAEFAGEFGRLLPCEAPALEAWWAEARDAAAALA